MPELYFKLIQQNTQFIIAEPVCAVSLYRALYFCQLSTIKLAYIPTENLKSSSDNVWLEFIISSVVIMTTSNTTALAPQRTLSPSSSESLLTPLPLLLPNPEHHSLSLTYLSPKWFSMGCCWHFRSDNSLTWQTAQTLQNINMPCQ